MYNPESSTKESTKEGDSSKQVKIRKLSNDYDLNSNYDGSSSDYNYQFDAEELPTSIMDESEIDGAEIEVQPRSAHDIRNRFLSRLVVDKVWKTPARKGKPHQSIVILDWDDTLFCTSAFHP